MQDDESPLPTRDSLARRRVPCMIAYLQPFRIVSAKHLSPWSPTINDINHGTWDYVALHELVGQIDIGLPPPFNLVVSRDGGLAVPPLETLRSPQAATEFFNRCLAGLLIGGIYCEAISPDGLDTGSIIDWKYIRSRGEGQAAENRFHMHVRRSKANPIEAIALLEPRTLLFDDLDKAMRIGLQVLNKVPALGGEFLLKGATGIARRDLGSALANLWIVAEQITSELWDAEVVKPTLLEDGSSSRRSQLNDTRTWTMSARLEMLFQKNILDPKTFRFLSAARKARNDLSHNGKHPSESDAQSAYRGVIGLMTLALKEERVPLFDVDLSDHSISEPFKQRGPIDGEPRYWMEIPKLPGEAELERAEAKLMLEERLAKKS